MSENDARIIIKALRISFDECLISTIVGIEIVRGSC